MKQIVAGLVMEYTSYIFCIWAGLVIILLIAALYRIKRVERRLRKIIENAQRQTQETFENLALESLRAVKINQEAQMQAQKWEVNKGVLDKHSNLADRVQQESPENLLNAVLEEVFL